MLAVNYLVPIVGGVGGVGTRQLLNGLNRLTKQQLTTANSISNMIIEGLKRRSLDTQQRLRFFNTTSRFMYVRADHMASQLIRNRSMILNKSSPARLKIDRKSLTIKPPQASESSTARAETMSIFKRFKEAYKQHGKILICTHLVTSVGWITGFFMLAEGGFDITSLFGVLERLRVMSRETSDALVAKIENFRLEAFLRAYYADYVLSDAAIAWLGSTITGTTLKYAITAALLYKIFAPLRYLVTLGGTNLVIRLFKRKGVIPQQPPAGSSIRELYTEQKQVIRRGLKTQREKYRKRLSKR